MSIDLRLGDCLEVMKTIPTGSIDAIITDPPYGTTACKWDSVIPFNLMWGQLNRIIKPNGAIVLFGSEPFSSALRMSNIKNYKYDWIWDKVQPTGMPLVKRVPMKLHEIIIVFYSKQCVYNRQMSDRPKKDIRVNAVKNKLNQKTNIGYEHIGKMTCKYADDYDPTKVNLKALYDFQNNLKELKTYTQRKSQLL